MLLKADTGYLGADIDYTLRAFPNHHRALMAAMRYGEKTKSEKPPNMRYSIECYFDRAIRFRPDDAIPRMIYSMYLAKNGRIPEALQQLDITANGAEGKENPFTHYNLGLNYFDLKEYEKSEIQAHKAYDMGFIQPALKEKLKSVGKWTESEVVPPNAGTSAPVTSN
jgi:tetratricopeptide (TPR) repeat protein